ncbi:permease prefix domain 1-containing protein [Priestia megaterium]
MNEKIKNHVHNILAPYQDVKNVQDLEEELSQNLQEKFTDYKKDGHNEEQAYYMTINSIGDITELIQSINVETK